MQPDNPVICPYLPARFNPHPSRRTGATWMRTAPRTGQLGFNPHPSRRTGATSPTHHVEPSSRSFNPHPSRRTGATQALLTQIEEVIVSILTRPEGRVQPNVVSTFAAGTTFQSSPVPKDGCNSETKTPTKRGSTFQSSPVPKDGCNHRASDGLLLAPGFNPHPSRRTGATRYATDINAHQFAVSILTRPEGRVQRARDTSIAHHPVSRFNPHPSRRTGATPHHSHGRQSSTSFNPHPSRRTGATGGGTSAVDGRRRVSILTRPEGRVQLHLLNLAQVQHLVSILTRPEGRVQRVLWRRR